MTASAVLAAAGKIILDAAFEAVTSEAIKYLIDGGDGKGGLEQYNNILRADCKNGDGKHPQRYEEVPLSEVFRPFRVGDESDEE